MSVPSSVRSVLGSPVPFPPELVSDSPYTARQVFAEWAHRGVAVIVGLGVRAATGVAYRRRKQSLVRRAAAAAGLLLPVQVLLGGLAVPATRRPLIVTGHPGIGVLLLPMLCPATVAEGLGGDSSADESGRKGSPGKGT